MLDIDCSLVFNTFMKREEERGRDSFAGLWCKRLHCSCGGNDNDGEDDVFM